MIRMLSMSLRRGKVPPLICSRDTPDELIEKVAGVAWSGTGFWVVLNATSVKLFASQALYRTIVEITVGQLDAFRHGLFADGEAVILARNLDPSRMEVADRVVCAMMPKRHLVRLAT